MSSLSELIERVEKASGPDRELDVAIILTLFPGAGPHQPYCKGDEPIFFNEPYRKQECPKLTSSIDAALTLVPQEQSSNFEVCLEQSKRQNRQFWTATIGHVVHDAWEAIAPTPALALVAACLKARLLDAASSEVRG